MRDKIVSARPLIKTRAAKTTAGQTRRISNQAQQVREGMLHAAAQAFARRGLEATTMQDIAREAGYTVPSLYAYFNGKQDIIEALLQRMGEQLTRTFTDPMPAGLTFPQMLELLLQRQLEFGQEWREAFKVIFGVKAKKEPYAKSLSRWITEVSRPEDLGDYDADEFAGILQGILHATFDRWLRTRQPPRLADRASSITHLLFHGVLSERRPAKRQMQG